MRFPLRSLFPLSLALLCAAALPAQAQQPLVRAGRDGSKVSSTLSGVTIDGVTPTDFGFLNGLTGPIQTQINNVSTSVTNLTAGATTLFLHNAASGVAAYETLRTQPSAGSEVTESVNVTSGGGAQLIDCYISDAGYPGQAKIPAGIWRFHDFATVDNNTGVSQIRVQVKTRTSGGVETTHFTSDGPELVVGTTEYQWSYSQGSDLAIAVTDRLLVCYLGVTTSAGSRTITHYYEGTAHASHLDTPIPSPVPISGGANLVLATPNGSTGVAVLRQVVGADVAASTLAASKLDAAAQARLCPTPAVAGGLCFDTGTGYQVTAAGTAAQVLIGGSTPSFQTLSAANVPAFFRADYGNGSDGDVTCSGATTLSRVMFYNNLTVQAGCDLKPTQYAIFVAGVLSITGGSINSNGTNGPSSTGATQCTVPTAKTIGAGGLGGYSATFNQDGFPTSTGGVGQSVMLGGNGGNGGTGGSGAGFAGGGTTLSYKANVNVGWFRRENLLRGHAFSPLVPGTTGFVVGGGGGALGGSGSGGVGASGGCGGDVIIIRARTMSLTGGTIQVKGGNGANASNTNAGGGGGGGGGAIILDTLSYTNTGTTLDVAGGNGGTGNGTGASGVNGSSGVALTYFPQVP